VEVKFLLYILTSTSLT